MSEQQQNSEYSQKYSSISLELKVSSNSWEIDGETVETVSDLIFLGSKITADGDCSHEIKSTCSLEESYDKPRQHMKKQRHYFANKGSSSQSFGFSSSHVRVGLKRLSAKELMFLNCGVGEDF